MDWQPTTLRADGSVSDDSEDVDEDYEEECSGSYDEEDEEDVDTDQVGDEEGDTKGAVAHASRLADGSSDTVASFLSCLEQLGDVTLTQQFLRVVVPKDNSVQLTLSFLNYCGMLGLAQVQEEFKYIWRNTTADTLDRNIRLFDLLCSSEIRAKDEYRRLRAAVVHDLVAGLKNIDKQKDDWRSSKINRSKVLADLVKPLIATEEFEGLASLVSYTLATPQHYAPRLLAKLLCQLGDWLAQNCVRSCAITKWLDSSLSFVQKETTQEPQKPADFRREANISCRCGECKELIEFLKSPTQAVYLFKVRKERRAHLHQIIDLNGCDVNHVTERKGSPQTLVCTKNTGSHQRRLQQYLEDKETLVVLQSLEKQLSSEWANARH